MKEKEEKRELGSREEIERQMAELAREYAGTDFDLDPALEAAGIECILADFENDLQEK
jgi:hypothetical protein